MGFHPSLEDTVSEFLRSDDKADIGKSRCFSETTYGGPEQGQPNRQTSFIYIYIYIYIYICVCVCVCVCVYVSINACLTACLFAEAPVSLSLLSMCACVCWCDFSQLAPPYLFSYFYFYWLVFFFCLFVSAFFLPTRKGMFSTLCKTDRKVRRIYSPMDRLAKNRRPPEVERSRCFYSSLSASPQQPKLFFFFLFSLRRVSETLGHWGHHGLSSQNSFISNRKYCLTDEVKTKKQKLAK